MDVLIGIFCSAHPAT